MKTLIGSRFPMKGGPPRRWQSFLRALPRRLEPGHSVSSLASLTALPGWRAFGYAAARRSRSALVMTETEDRLMAAPASMGESSSPKKG
jgi:hypothetical protein